MEADANAADSDDDCSDWNAWNDCFRPTTTNALPPGAAAHSDSDQHGAEESESQSHEEWELLLESMMSNARESTEQQDEQHHHESCPSTGALSEAMFGRPRDLQRIGLPIQKDMFTEFLRVAKAEETRRPGTPLLKDQETLEDKLAKEFVHEPGYKSMRCEAASSEQAVTSLKRNLLEYGTVLLFGAAFLIGTFFCAWIELFKKRKYVPVMAVSKVKSDETPLKLRVHEANAFFNVDAAATSEHWPRVSVKKLLLANTWNMSMRRFNGYGGISVPFVKFSNV